MNRFKNKTVIVTGASSGIGKQTAIGFAKEGANLAICARREVKLKETAALCEAEGASVLAMICDVTKKDQLTTFVNAIHDKFGTVDVLVNNAASANVMIPFIQQSENDLNMALQSEVFATWNMMQLCYPLMKENGGSVINFGSNAAQGIPGYASYSAAKAAIMALTRSVAKEWGADNIKINNMIPVAITDTNRESTDPNYQKINEVMYEAIIAQSPFHRLSNPEEDIVPVILFMASDESRWMTGQDFHAEGGLDIHF